MTALATNGRRTGTQVASRPAQIRDLLGKMSSEIAKALPKHMTPDRMIRVAATAIIKNPDLMKCSDVSLCKAVTEASQLGLDLDGVLGQAYLVPYGNVCQLIPGYRGLIMLARRSGEILDIAAELVYARDVFKIQKGSEPKLVHEPTLENDRGPVIGAYAIAFLKGAMPHYEFMRTDEIEAIKARSKASTKGPWRTDWGEMAKKTATRRLCKWLPMSVELERGLELDARAESGNLDIDVNSSTRVITGQSVLDQLPGADPEPADQPPRIADEAVDNLADLATEAGVVGPKLKDALSSFGVGEIMDLTPEQAEQFQVFCNGLKS